MDQNSNRVAYVLLIDDGYYSGKDEMDLPMITFELRCAKLFKYHEAMAEYNSFRKNYNQDRIFDLEIRQVS